MLSIKAVGFLGAAGTALALALAGVQTLRLNALQVELADQRTSTADVALTYAENARKVEDAWRKRVTDAQRTREAELAATRSTDVALRDDADGMRDDFQAYARGGPGDTADACRVRAATLGNLLARALSADRRHTERAETHAADARSLSAPGSVTNKAATAAAE